MLKTIKSNWLTARKAAISNKEFTLKANLLGTLIGEVEMLAKNDSQRAVTDADCVIKIKAFIKAIDQTLAVCASDKLVAEKAILESFLPKQMTENEIKVAVENIISGGASDMGKVMSILKKEYDGLYDGRVASTIVKESLKRLIK